MMTLVRVVGGTHERFHFAFEREAIRITPRPGPTRLTPVRTIIIIIIVVVVVVSSVVALFI